MEQPREAGVNVVTRTAGNRSPLLDERGWLGFAALQHGREDDGVLKLNYGDLLDETIQWMEVRSEVLRLH